MYMNLNTEIEQMNNAKGKKILNTFMSKKANIDIYNQNEQKFKESKKIISIKRKGAKQ